MIVQDMEKLVGFTLDFVQERQLLDEAVVSDLARRGEECKSAEEINGWLGVVRGSLKEPQYKELKDRFEETNSSKKRKASSVDTGYVRNKEARFALDFVQEAQLLTEEVVAHLTKHAEGNNTTKDHVQWMTFVKHKIGAFKHREMQKAYAEFCKKDCGFESTTPDEIMALLKKYASFEF